MHSLLGQKQPIGAAFDHKRPVVLSNLRSLSKAQSSRLSRNLYAWSGFDSFFPDVRDRPMASRRPPTKMLYTPDQRRRRDASRWTMVQGILAPLQFLVFLVSAGLVLRYLATGEGLTAATISIVVKTFVLYTIMVTGSLWEHDVYGRYLFAPAFFWEDAVSMLVLALHTAYLGALATGWLSPRGQMLLALAAYAAYVVNATQFVLKLRAARRGQRPAATSRPRGMRAMTAHATIARDSAAPGCVDAPVLLRTWPARGVLRADRHRLASPQDPGRVFPRGRIAHLRASHPVRRRCDDLRRTALRDGDHRGARSRRIGRRRCRARSHRCRPAGAASRHPAPVPGRLLPLRGHQARLVAGGGAAVGRPMRRVCASSIIPAAGSKRPSPRAKTRASLRWCLSSRRRADGKSLLVVGALAEVVEDQFRRQFGELGIGEVRFLPPRRAAALPPVGPGTTFVLAQPFLADTARALEERGARRLAAPFPLGVEGTTLWLQSIAETWKVDPTHFARVTSRAARAGRSGACNA